MKRFHVHVAVADLEQSIQFYSTFFNITPTVKKDDYAKWMLDDPRINFAISTRGREPGLDHLGIQVDDGEALKEISLRHLMCTTANPLEKLIISVVITVDKMLFCLPFV